MVKKYNVTKDGKLFQVTIENFNDCRIKFAFVNDDKPLPRDKTNKVMNVFVGGYININGFQIACKGTNYSFNEMRERNAR